MEMRCGLGAAARAAHRQRRKGTDDERSATQKGKGVEGREEGRVPDSAGGALP